MPTINVATTIYGGLGQQGLNPAKVLTVDAFIAPVNTAYNANTMINGGWISVGRLQAGSYKNDFSRKFYDVMTGLPETAKESFVVGVDGKFQMNLIEPTARAFELANGGDTGIPIFRTVPLADTVAATAPAQGSFTLTTGLALTVGMQLEVTLSTGKEYTYVSAYNSGTKLVTVFPALSAVPATPNPVKVVDGWEEPMGTATLNYFAFRTVASCADGSQIVTWSPKIRSNGVKDEMPQGKEMFIPLDLFCYGFSDANYNSSLVAKKYVLNSTVAVPLLS